MTTPPTPHDAAAIVAATPVEFAEDMPRWVWEMLIDLVDLCETAQARGMSPNTRSELLRIMDHIPSSVFLAAKVIRKHYRAPF